MALKNAYLNDLYARAEKRNAGENEFLKTVTHTVDGETYTLAPGDLKWIFPVNQEILDFQPDMPQYDRK